MNDNTMELVIGFSGLLNVFLLMCISSPEYALAQLNLPIFDFIYQRTNNFNESILDTNLFYKEYDFIVIGSGSGGSVVANRLTEINGFSVLLLEAGVEENFISDVPLTPSATQLTSKRFYSDIHTCCGMNFLETVLRYLLALFYGNILAAQHFGSR